MPKYEVGQSQKATRIKLERAILKYTPTKTIQNLVRDRKLSIT